MHVLTKIKKISSPLICPYCKELTLGVSQIAKCSNCGTIHHVDCWQSNGSCSIFGCHGTLVITQTEDHIIEVFQYRRKMLLLLSLFPITTALFVITFCSMLGAKSYLGVLILFVLCIPWMLAMYGLQDAYFRCPACGKHPIKITHESPREFGDLSSLGKNPAYCIHCRVALR